MKHRKKSRALFRCPVATSMILLFLLYATASVVLHAAVKSWHFDAPSDYVYDTNDIQVHNSVADYLEQGWWNNNWDYRRQIVLDNTAGSAQTNFQVLVELDNSNYNFASSGVRTDGYDVRFVSLDGSTVFDHWRQDFDSGAETGTFWVEIPAMPNAATMAMYIYYGNPSAPDTSNYTNVFYFVGEAGYNGMDPISTSFIPVSFANPFPSTPVVAASIQTAVDYPLETDADEHGNNCGGNNNGFADGTAEPRVRNIDTAGFEYTMYVKSIDCDNVHGDETIGWLALIEGTHVIGGRLVRVFQTNIGGGNENYSANIGFGATFPDLPVVLPQLQTFNESGAASVRMQNKSNSDIDAKIEEDREATHAVESAGFIVMDQAGIDDVLDATLGPGLEGEVGSTDEGAVQHIFQSTSFQHAFTNPPLVILKIQNDNGGNNGHERLKDITVNGFMQAFSENFYATPNSYDGIHFNDEGGSFVALGQMGSANYLPQYPYRRRISINNTSASNLTNFPIQIDLNAGNFATGFTNAKSDGSDIRFTQSDGATKLTYYYDPSTYNQAGQSATFYVKIPSLPSGGSVNIYIYYGFPYAGTESNYQDVFPVIGEANRTPDEVMGITDSPFWWSYTFTNTYTNPPVLLHMVARDGGNVGTSRVKNITTTGFQVTCEEASWRDGAHTAEEVSWIVIEEGTYNYNGYRIEAWRETNIDHTYSNISYPNGAFTSTPVIIANIDGTDTSNYFIANGNSGNRAAHVMIDNVTTSDFDLRLEETDRESDQHPLNPETIMIVAMESGAYDAGSGGEGSFEATLENFRNNGGNSYATINYSFNFQQDPAVVAQTMSENDTEPVVNRYSSSNSNTTQASLQIQAADESNYNTNEDVGHLSFAIGDIVGTPASPAPYPSLTFNSEESITIDPILLYARKYQPTEPSTTLGSVEVFNRDPVIKPTENKGISFFELNSMSETVRATGTAEIRYQITRRYDWWYYVATGTNVWTLATAENYYQANTIGELTTARLQDFDDQTNKGTFYFKAILHPDSVSDDIDLDEVSLDYTPSPDAPVISGISPSPASLFATVTVSGTGFGAIQGTSKIFFNGCEGTSNVVSWSNTDIEVNIPTCATDGPVVVVVAPYISNDYTYSIATPNISFLDPSKGDIYQVVKIYGTNFGHVQGDSYVEFSPGVYAQIGSWSNTLIRAVVPVGSASGNATVTMAGHTSNGVNFKVVPDASRWPFSTPSMYIVASNATVTTGFAETKTINVPDWIDRKWLYRRRIRLDNHTGKPNDYQAKVVLDGVTDIFSKANTNGEDVRITAEDGKTQIDYWIESWDATANTATLWVNMPCITCNRIIYLYYGNSSAPAVSSYLNTLDFIGQTGTTARTVTDSWSDVSLSTNFTSDPVVVATLSSYYDADSGHVRIRNIDGTGARRFQVAIENSRNAGSAHGTEEISWIAIVPGSWHLGGLHLEAGSFTGVNRSWSSYETYTNAFSAAPSLIAMQQTANLFDPDGNGSKQIRIYDDGGSLTRFRARMEGDDDSQPGNFSNDENVGYIAFEVGTADNSLPNLEAYAGRTSSDFPNEFYWSTVDTIAAFTSSPSNIISVITVNEEGGENTCHPRLKSVTPATFQLKCEECTDCDEGHTTETFGWISIDSGAIYGRKYGGAETSAIIGGEQTPEYDTSGPAVYPVELDGEPVDGLAGLYERLGYENVGEVRYQITNDSTGWPAPTWYWYDTGASMWATATLGMNHANTIVEMNEYAPLFDVKYGTGTFWFRAFLVSDGSQLVQLDGVGIVQRSETLTAYAWATNQAATPIFYETNKAAALNPGKKYLLGIQVQHDGLDDTYNFQLQYQRDPYGTPGAWTNVTLLSTDWKAVDGPWGNHDDNVPVASFRVNGGVGVGTASDGVYTENGVVAGYDFGNGQYYTELWYAIQPDIVASGTAYAFRVTNGISYAAFRYDQFPFAGPAPAITMDITSDISGVTHESVPVIDMSMTCYDRADSSVCDAADFMRFTCDETLFPSLPWVAYADTYNGAFNITTGPGCNNSEGVKKIFFQVMTDSEIIQVAPATDSTYFDKTAPVMDNSTILTVTSDNETYFYGTNDGISCLADDVPLACTVWYNNLAGEGADQDITIMVASATVTEVNPWKFVGEAAFGDSPAADISSSGGWTVTYGADAAQNTNFASVTFTFHDLVSTLGGHTDSFDITFRRDVEAPDTVGVVTGYENLSMPLPALTSGSWYNYSNPYFDWAEPADYPIVLPSGVYGYAVSFATDSGAGPVIVYTASNFRATGPLNTSGSQTYYLNIKTLDRVGKESPVVTEFIYRYDPASPTFVYNYPTGGAPSTWYNADPGAVFDVDLGFGTGSPLVTYQYSIGSSGVWNSIWSGSQAATYTTDWGVNWAGLAEGTNEIHLRGVDDAGNVATSTFATGTDGFVIRRDTVPPVIKYTSPATGAVTAWYTTDPGNVIDIDLLYSSGSPITDFEYRIGTGAWTSIWSGSQTASQTVDWSVLWGSLSEGINEVSLRGIDAAGNIATHTYATGVSGFVFRKDSLGPSFKYNSPATGSVINWVNSDPGPYDVDLIYDLTTSPIAQFDYQINSGAWTSIWTGSQTASYTTDWNIPWAGIPEGRNDINLRGIDALGNAATDTFSAGTAGFQIWKDTVDPFIRYAGFATGSPTQWYNSNPGAVIDIDLQWISDAQIVRFDYQVGAGSWRNIWSGSQYASYTTNWEVFWNDTSEGLNQINIRGIDAAGNVATHTFATGTTGFTFRRDTVAPVIKYNTPATGTPTVWYGSDPGAVIDIDLLWASGSPITQFDYQVGAGAWTTIWAGSQTSSYTVDWGIPWGDLAEGENQISLRAMDAAGNVATHSYSINTAGFIFRKGTAAGIIKYNAPATGTPTIWYNADPGVFVDIDLLWVGGPPITDFEYQVGSGAWTSIWSGSQSSNYTADWSIPWGALPEGKNEISIRGINSAARVATDAFATTSAGFLFRKDTMPPAIKYTYAATGGPTNWYGSDPGAVVDIDLFWASGSQVTQLDYRIGAGAWTNVWTGSQYASYTTNWSVNWAGLSEGANAISLRAYDGAGNSSIHNFATGSYGFSFRRDTVPPVIDYNSPATGTHTVWYSADPGAVIDIDLIRASGSPITSFEYQVGTGSWNTVWSGSQTADYTANWTAAWASMSEGLNRVSLRARDSVGNVATHSFSTNTYGFVFRRDNSAPNNPASVTAYEDPSMTPPVLVSGASNDSNIPYFTWAAPSDNPSVQKSGVAGYYVAMATNSSFDLTATASITSTAFGANLPNCGATYTLYMKTFDNAVPPNVSATAALFDYYYSCGITPDYIKVTPQDDSLITADTAVTSWCFGSGCSPACNVTGTDLWCSNTGATITVRPEYLKFENATQDIVFSRIADNAVPALSQWSYDSGQGRLMLANSNNPSSGANVAFTSANGAEEICIELYDASDTLITQPPYGNAQVSLILSKAADSGKDITAAGSTSFGSVSQPAAGDLTAPDQTYIKGTLNSGRACVILTAETTPSDSPQTPITVVGYVYDGGGATMSLPQTGGAKSTATVYIRSASGFASGSTIVGGVTDVTNAFVPTPSASDTAIVMTPDWNHTGNKLAFVSRQSDPCDDGSVTDSYHTGFNIYTMELSGGVLTNCRILSSNDSSGRGVQPASEVAWSSSNDTIVFTAKMPTTNKRKLLWVSATGTVGTAVGSQSGILAVSDSGAQGSTGIMMDAFIGSNQVMVMDSTNFTVGNEMIIGVSPDFGSSYNSSYQVVTITAVIPGFPTTIQFAPALSATVPSFSGGGVGWIKSPYSLADIRQSIVPLSDQSNWIDPDWSPDDANCTAAYRDSLIAVREPVNAPVEDMVCNAGSCVQNPLGVTSNANIVRISGSKQWGVFNVDYSSPVSDLEKVTNFTSGIYPLKPKWSPDCEMIAFLAWDASAEPAFPSKTSVYVINLANTGSGFATASLPVTSLTDKGVYKIYDFASNSIQANTPAWTPNWSADAKLVSYAVDKNQVLNITNLLNTDPDNVVPFMLNYTGFDSYMEYIPDQPPSQGAVFSPQIVGKVSYNEFGLVQCPGNLAGANCGVPDTNYPFVHVAQLNSTDGGFLRMFSIDDESDVGENGGLLFQDGIVTAVFPPNVVASDTVFWNEDPTIGYCGGSVGAGNCPLDPTNDFIVQAGDAREFFPDGTNFESYVRLIFHYCDNDGDGFVDAGTEGIESAVSGGAYAYNPLTGECSIGGVPTSGGTIDADTLAVYNWDTANAQWVRMEGIVDQSAKTITVFSTHFSMYEPLGFREAQQAVIQPLSITDIHTYPNPYIKSQHPIGITFSAGNISGGSNVTIDIDIYDIRGSQVARLSGIVPSNFASVYQNNAYTLLQWTNPVNNAGRDLASGVYLYYLRAYDLNGYEVTYKGKFSVVR